MDCMHCGESFCFYYLLLFSIVLFVLIAHFELLSHVNVMLLPLRDNKMILNLVYLGYEEFQALDRLRLRQNLELLNDVGTGLQQDCFVQVTRL